MKHFVLILALLLAAPLARAASMADLSSLLKKGDELDAQLRNAEALVVFQQAEALAPNDLEVLRRISREYALRMTDTTDLEEKKKLGAKAIAYAEKCLEVAPGAGIAHLAMAICYGRMAPLMDNKTKIAYSKIVKEHADKALAANPAEDYACHVLGAWNYELANINVVTRTMAKVVYGTLPSASNEDAVKYLSRAVQLKPDRVCHHIMLGKAYAAMNRPDLAREEINKGLNLPSREKDDNEMKRRGAEALKKL